MGAMTTRLFKGKSLKLKGLKRARDEVGVFIGF
jgi:hypothetical protein